MTCDRVLHDASSADHQPGLLVRGAAAELASELLHVHAVLGATKTGQAGLTTEAQLSCRAPLTHYIACRHTTRARVLV